MSLRCEQLRLRRARRRAGSRGRRGGLWGGLRRGTHRTTLVKLSAQLPRMLGTSYLLELHVATAIVTFMSV